MTTYGAKDMAESFRTVRKNTIQVAQDIPEDKYDYRPAEGVMTVGEMLAHLASSTHWAEQLHFVENKSDVTYEDFGRYMAEGAAVSAGLKTKTDIVAALESRGHDFACKLEQLTDEQLAEHVSFPAPIQPPEQVAVRDAAVGEGARDAPPRSADAHRAAARHRPAPHSRPPEPVDPADGAPRERCR